MVKKKAVVKPSDLSPLVRFDMHENLGKCLICMGCKPSVYYNFKRYCCVARYLSILPSKRLRNAWIEYLDKFYNKAVISEIKRQTIKIMKNKAQKM